MGKFKLRTFPVFLFIVWFSLRWRFCSESQIDNSRLEMDAISNSLQDLPASKLCKISIFSSVAVTLIYVFLLLAATVFSINAKIPPMKTSPISFQKLKKNFCHLSDENFAWFQFLCLEGAPEIWGEMPPRNPLFYFGRAGVMVSGKFPFKYRTSVVLKWGW